MRLNVNEWNLIRGLEILILTLRILLGLGKKRGTRGVCTVRWWSEPLLPGYGEGDAVKRQIGRPTAEELVPGARTPSQRFTVQLPACKRCAVSVQTTMALAWRDVTAVQGAREKGHLIQKKTSFCRADKCHFQSAPFCFVLSGTIQITPALSLEPVGGITAQRTSWKEEEEKNSYAYPLTLTQILYW